MIDELVVSKDIKSLIYEVRGRQVMIDKDVARLYGYETMRINETVKRNIQRFPEEFCFQLTYEEYKDLISQFAISSLHGGRRKIPYVFTEHGILMLAGLLKNVVAIDVSIKIVNAFVEMRKFLNSNGSLFEKIIIMETEINSKFLDYDHKFNEIFSKLQQEENFKQKIFFNGQIYDAYSLIVDIIKQAKESIILIDNYVDKTILDLLSRKNINVAVLIITNSNNKLTELDITKFNKQYPHLKIKYSSKFHDRFIIIDKIILYHCGASIKDLGKKIFSINQMEDVEMLDSLFTQI